MDLWSPCEKRWVWWQVLVIPELGKVGKSDPQSDLLASLAYLVSSRSLRDPILKINQ